MRSILLASDISCLVAFPTPRTQPQSAIASRLHPLPHALRHRHHAAVHRQRRPGARPRQEGLPRRPRRRRRHLEVPLARRAEPLRALQDAVVPGEGHAQRRPTAAAASPRRHVVEELSHAAAHGEHGGTWVPVDELRQETCRQLMSSSNGGRVVYYR